MAVAGVPVAQGKWQRELPGRRCAAALTRLGAVGTAAIRSRALMSARGGPARRGKWGGPLPAETVRHGDPHRREPRRAARVSGQLSLCQARQDPPFAGGDNRAPLVVLIEANLDMTHTDHGRRGCS